MTKRRFATYAQARDALLDKLQADGWRLSSRSLKVPHATAPGGRVRLWLKTRSVYEGATRPAASITGGDVDIRRETDFEQVLDYARRRAAGMSTAGVFAPARAEPQTLGAMLQKGLARRRSAALPPPAPLLEVPPQARKMWGKLAKLSEAETAALTPRVLEATDAYATSLGSFVSRSDPRVVKFLRGMLRDARRSKQTRAPTAKPKAKSRSADPLLKVGLQPAGAKAQARRLARSRAAALRAKDREKLARIRAELQQAKLRRRAAMRRAVELCRRGRRKAREAIARLRKRERERINAEAAKLRESARQRCAERKSRIRRSAGSVAERTRKRLLEERQLQAQLRRYAQTASQRRAKVTGRERAQESDEAVRGDLPPELRPVFDQVKARIRPGPRTTRTEAFLEWAAENPQDVVRLQADQSDREVARLVREREKIEKRLAKAKAYDVSPEDFATLERMGLAPNLRAAGAAAKSLHWEEAPF